MMQIFSQKMKKFGATKKKSKEKNSSHSDSTDSDPSRPPSPLLEQSALGFATPPEDRKEIPDVLLTPDESFS